MDNSQIDESQTSGNMPVPSQDTISSLPTDSAQAPIPHRIGDEHKSPVTPPELDSGDNGSASSAEDSESTTSSSSSVMSFSYPLPPTSTPPTEVLELDKKTPDAHVPRDSRLIRLTGVHPFNVEAPLSALYNEGFLTTQELFYVRNHGAVPEVQEEDIMDWEFSVEGYVKSTICKYSRLI
jgi:nitrate reductase (NAD(P)H)